ncbi:MAG TPA: metalloregulator ArsR/SmtB family transcription factor [Bacteroidales bacterium]|jgi:ArsR family transcriptional regulator|nr:metalloregulator ArsR/SmtB family transcription factor [Bacteroidales bacterium]HNZ42610.1 metalloregulator ArsR/SmtB family transcription factor [Bacteroidales bacterium]HOH84157.1 metalloregulator ArsR/SmtB family transcription factor [Bacteroidales bacterium]HOV11115.1 metalloregulator ArsR/SmtB family transcription factor [Bacteroidales bacterium]HPB26199.1 metalloregulator ArsR/SmtB family transcription factor [Bacteroidales bacterium]
MRSIAHPMRINIIELLEANKEMNVTQIYEKLNIEQAAASLHLNLLRTHGILNRRRSGKMTFYSLKNDSLNKLIDFVENCNK